MKQDRDEAAAKRSAALTGPPHATADDIEMRENYDFSSAVPARHAARLDDRSRRELLRRSASQDVQAWITHSLLQIQALETTLVLYLALAWKNSPREAGRKAATLLEGGDRRSWKRLLAEIGEHGNLGPEFESRFVRLLDGRRWLVHRSAPDIQIALADAPAVLPLLRRLETLVEGAISLAEELRNALDRRLNADGLSDQEIERESDQVIEQWRAA